jgi:predicted nucleic acid-binding protein
MIAADATTLIAMSLLGRTDLVRRLVGTVTVGEATAREIRTAVETLEPGCQPPGDDLMEVSYVDVTAPILSRSESETVLLARENGARYALTDDPIVRRELEAYNVRAIGTPGLLYAAHEHGMIQDLSDPVRRLHQVGYGLSEECEARLLQLAQEE